MRKEEQITQLLHDIRGVLAYQQASFIKDYPESSELTSFLDGCRMQEPVPSAPSPGSTATNRGSQPAVEVVRKSDRGSLAEIAAEVSKCTGCTLGAHRSRAVSGCCGGENVRLLVVGDWLSAAKPSPESVFGEEEDLMLARMLAAIHLPMKEVFVTNVIKCGVGPGVRPQPEHIESCVSYLRRQITAVAPELICTMGTVATRTLLRRSQPLSRLRGHFYSYQGAGGVEIPVLPTYHPGYLLQNPEMKKATWHDLQALAKWLKRERHQG